MKFTGYDTADNALATVTIAAPAGGKNNCLYDILVAYDTAAAGIISVYEDLGGGDEAVLAVFPFASALNAEIHMERPIIAADGLELDVTLTAQGTGGQYGHVTLAGEVENIVGM